MNRMISLLAAALMLVSSGMSAQSYSAPAVTISAEKVKKDGVIYYSHVVQEKQTLYSISKAYNVPVHDVIIANPEQNLQKESVKAGAVLLIPVTSANGATIEDTGRKDAAKAEAAPVAAEPVKEAEVVNAPAEPVKEPEATAAGNEPAKGHEAVDTPSEPEYFIYTVKWYEDLSIVAKKYNTTKEVLMAFNGMDSPKVVSRQELKIPVHPELVDIQAVANSTQVSESKSTPLSVDGIQDSIKAGADSLQSKIETLATNLGEKIENLFSDNTPADNVSVSILLPLSTKGDISSAHYDFYSGALLAIRDLAGEGISTDLNVFDIGSGINVSAGELSGSDLIIGPVSTKDIDSVLRIVGDGREVISPLDPRALKLTDGHTGLIHAPSSSDAQFQDIVKWIRKDMRAGDKLILITEEKGKVSDLARHIQESGLEFSTLSYGILMSSKIDSKLESVMSQNATNRFVIASDSEAFVNDAVRNINLMVHRKYDVVLYAPSKMRNFDTIEAEHLHDANLHLSSSYYVDYEQTKVKHFLLSYRALFGTEPTPFAYQGYDTTYYLLKSYSKSPARWTEDITNTRHKGLQSDFKFERKEGGGLYNTAVRRIVYHPDYSFTLVEESQGESIL